MNPRKLEISGKILWKDINIEPEITEQLEEDNIFW